MSLKNISIKLPISLAVSSLPLLILVQGALDLAFTQRVKSQVEDVSLRDAQQQAMTGGIMLRMETNRSQILQAFQHNLATGYTKMHDDPPSVHFKASAGNTVELNKARPCVESALQAADAKALAKEWQAKLAVTITLNINEKVFGTVEDVFFEVVTLRSEQIRPVAKLDGAITTAFITGIG